MTQAITRCKDTNCPQASTCQRFDKYPEDKKGKYYFIKSPRGPIGCLEYKRRKETK
jgi:hypothetical protein